MEQAFFRSLRSSPDYDGQLVSTAVVPEHPANFGEPARPLPASLRAALEARGIRRLYSHQARALDAVRAGRQVAVVTPTASGKTLTCLLPILERLLQEPDAKALFLYPIKALAQDQLGIFEEWMQALWPPEPGAKKKGSGRVAIYDGDTAPSARTRLRGEPPSLLLSNPDMLHRGLLPFHSGWGKFLSKLRFVVVDEAHSYRGVFGAHVAMALRRLRRLARFYGSDPQFIFLSATIANPGDFAGRLLGEEVAVVDGSGAPSGKRHVGLWNPLASPYRESTDLLGRLLEGGHKTIAFTKARKITELMSLWLGQGWPRLKEKTASYRAGYLPAQRREIEQRLFKGELDGVIATSALELGIDVGGLDACLMVGFPGTMISARQRMGRVGRSGQESVVLLVGLNDALDQYFMRHPEAFYQRPTEQALLPLDNPVVLAAHLGCAAAELPLDAAEDAKVFGPRLEERCQELWRAGRLRQGADGKYFAVERQPSRAVNLRSSGASYAITLGEGKDAQWLGTLEVPRVYRDGHPGAIYLHQGAQYEVLALDQVHQKVMVRELEADYYTEPRGDDNVEILRVEKRRELGGLAWCYGAVKAREQVTGFVRKHVSTQKVLGEEALDMPLHEYETRAAWWELPSAWRKEFAELGYDFAGSIHALEHSQIALLPVFALCDRWDLGGVSYWSQPQLDQPAIFVYDGHAGGAALAEQGWGVVEPWLDAVIELLRDCACEEGCPACVYSPKCGNGNKPLDKRGALELAQRLRKRLEQVPLPLSPPSVPPIPTPSSPVGSSSITPPTPSHSGKGRGDLGSPPPTSPDGGGDRSDGEALTQNLVFFDLETQFLADEVGGWDNKAAMKVSVACTYSTKDGRYRQYTEGQIPALIEELKAADRVAGFNIKNFDYAVLQPYAPGTDLQALPTLDLLQVVTASLGRRLRLDSLATATLGAPKSADGLQAVRWWREGRLAELLAYCQKDVELTKDLWEFGRKYGYLLYEDRGGLMRVAVAW